MIDKYGRLLSIRKQLGWTQKQIADLLGIGQTAYSMIENGKTNLTNKNRRILLSKLYINPEYLDAGNGDLFLTAQESASLLALAGIDPPRSGGNGQGVPYYAKLINGSITDQYNHYRQDTEYYIDFKPFNDCLFYCSICGESMSPRFNPGDLIACKYIHNKDLILYGEAYLCVISYEGDLYETVKIIRRHSDPSYVVLRPVNPVFDETVVPLSSIKDLYIIKGRIERNL